MKKLMILTLVTLCSSYSWGDSRTVTEEIDLEGGVWFYNTNIASDAKINCVATNTQFNSGRKRCMITTHKIASCYITQLSASMSALNYLLPLMQKACGPNKKQSSGPDEFFNLKNIKVIPLNNDIRCGGYIANAEILCL